MTVLAAARVVTGEGGVSASPAWVAFEHGRITAVGAGEPPPSAVDLGDALLAPGYLDLQVNGHGTADFADASEDDIVGALEDLTAHGCTGCLPTLVSAPLNEYGPVLARLERVRDRPDASERATVLGVHLEGPFLGGAPGAHIRAHVRDVQVDWLVTLAGEHDGLLRLVTLAPEADPGLVATRALAARGIVVALGHSTVSYDGAREAADAGARLVTHVFNGMGPLHHREPGLPGAALDDRRLVPSLIADLVHVHPAVVRLAIAARPDLVLVSDAVAVSGPLRRGRGAAVLSDGTLAGSTITLGTAVANVAAVGVPVGQAVRGATGNPARVMGWTDRGRVAPGCRADLVALDPDTRTVRSVWIAGERR